MTQLFPGKIITTVSYGTSDKGFPIVLAATAEGDIIALEVRDPKGFTVTVLKGSL